MRGDGVRSSGRMAKTRREPSKGNPFQMSANIFHEVPRNLSSREQARPQTSLYYLGGSQQTDVANNHSPALPQGGDVGREQSLWSRGSPGTWRAKITLPISGHATSGAKMSLYPDYLKKFRPDLIVRRYQIGAMDTVSQQFDEKRLRKFLLEMATGTGKTLLCAALIRRFLQTRNAERVLFIVDRIELAKQTLEDFNVVLAEYKPVLYKTARRRPGELLGSSVVVATLQSLMVDRRYREEFTPFHFDLVVNDEAHRSIYGDAREVVQFFQATRIGLTATPKAYLKNVNVEQLERENPKALEARLLRDTYNYFGCKPGFPTFRYDIIDAVKDPEGPFLCLPKIVDLRSDITTKALTECDLQAVINLPSGVFKPYSGVGTAALVFEKGKSTKNVWFYDITADGFSLDDNRTPIEADDIPDVVAKWPKRDEGANSYRVPIEKIKENDWSLAAGRYKPVNAEAVNHDAPADILGEILKVENEIADRGKALLAQIGRKK